MPDTPEDIAAQLTEAQRRAVLWRPATEPVVSGLADALTWLRTQGAIYAGGVSVPGSALKAIADCVERHISALRSPSQEPPAPDDPLIEGLRERIDGVVEFQGYGCWTTCTGCYESEDGYPNGDYPHSHVLGCTLGGGCGECGGIGAVWDNTDWEEAAKWMLANDSAPPAGDAPITPDAEIARATLESVWQQARANHEGYSATGDNEHDIRFFALGLTGEAGEVANFVKKRWRDGDGHDDDLRKECADVFAYNIMLADALGMDPQSLLNTVAFKQAVFVEKMRARTPSEPEGEG